MFTPHAGVRGGAVALAVAVACGGVPRVAGAAEPSSSGAMGRTPGGEGPSPDKSRYTLFDPTPRGLMREMSTDRPDVTESPRTVDAGHVQVELSFGAYVRDEEGGVTSEGSAVLPFNVKLGLTNNVDLQLVVAPYVRQEVRSDAGSATADGFGDTQLRLKINLWGNDGGDTALAVMPYVQFPTAGDDLGSDHVQGGVIFPFSAALPAEFSLGLMGEIDVVRDEANEGYGVEFLHTVNLNRNIVGPLGGYVEYIGIAPMDTGGGYLALLGTGLTYRLSEDVQLDLGVNFGLSDHADDFEVFAGMSFRL
jgi:Putative MetA-pathway of phenol degradation